MSRLSSVTAFTLVNLNNLEYLKKAISLLRWCGFPVGKPDWNQNGGGGYTRHGRLIVGGDGGGGGRRSEDARCQTSFGAGFGGAQVGYALINASWLKLYPFVSGGGTVNSFNAHPKDSDNSPIVQGNWAPLLLIGVGIELRLPISRHLRPLIGVRFGYRRALVSRDFGSNVYPLPPLPRGEPFCRLLLGLSAGRAS